MLKIISIGLGASRIIEKLSIKEELCISQILVNDKTHFEKSKIKEKIHLEIPLEAFKNFSVDPIHFESYIKNNRSQLQSFWHDADFVFFLACLGESETCSILPVLTHWVMEDQTLAIPLLTFPFTFEGNYRTEKAYQILNHLPDDMDRAIFFNDDILSFVGKDAKFDYIFEIANDYVATGVRTLSQMLSTNGLFKVNFSDICEVFRNNTHVFMSVGEGRGHGGLQVAFKKALESPLFNEANMANLNHIIFHILVGKEGVPVREIDQGMKAFTEKLFPHSQIIFGADISTDDGDWVKVSIIAAHDLDQFAEDHPKEQDSVYQERQKNLLHTKGQFAKTEPTVYQGIDLDIPTYLRRRIKSI